MLQILITMQFVVIVYQITLPTLKVRFWGHFHNTTTSGCCPLSMRCCRTWSRRQQWNRLRRGRLRFHWGRVQMGLGNVDGTAGMTLRWDSGVKHHWFWYLLFLLCSVLTSSDLSPIGLMTSASTLTCFGPPGDKVGSGVAMCCLSKLFFCTSFWSTFTNFMSDSLGQSHAGDARTAATHVLWQRTAHKHFCWTETTL